MLGVAATGDVIVRARCSVSAVSCHQKGTFSGDKSLLCLVKDFSSDSVCGYVRCLLGKYFWPAGSGCITETPEQKASLYFHLSFVKGWINCPELP